MAPSLEMHAFETEAGCAGADAKLAGQSTATLLSNGRRVSCPVPAGTASEGDLVMNLVTGGLGTGILCLPWLTAGASLVPTILIIIAILAFNVWTIQILVEAADKHQLFDLGSLLAVLPGQLGPAAQHVCNVTIWVSTFFSLVNYIMVISQSAEPFQFLGATTPGSPAAWEGYVFITTALICPLCFLDQSKLAFTSTFTVLVFIYIFLVLLAKPFGPSGTGIHETTCYFGTGIGSIAMYGGMSNCVVIQQCILPMYEELRDRTPSTMGRAVNHSFAALAFLFCAFGVLGYMWKGNYADENILNEISNADIFGQLAHIGCMIAVMGVYPIIANPMVAPIRNTPSLKKFEHIVTFGIVASSGAVAYVFLFNGINIGAMSVINGAICAGVFCGALPALIGCYQSGLSNKKTALLLAVGVVSLVLGILYQDNYVDDLKCLSNTVPSLEAVQAVSNAFLS
eukprot:TRINITY_DN11519_c0_g1_i2.p1 TRINITY_DN11519_c0_g1~~TRINITY_DN11519_c0_g1_i2.p1  ORF type:complete len:488 (-),score=57.72 TRINITY_DN11519_c0_g1_i2:247-1611(-)